MSDIEAWINERGVTEVECLVPDMNGVLRGKVLPAGKFIEDARAGTIRLASSAFAVSLTGGYAYADDDLDEAYRDRDLALHPDLSTLRVSPAGKGRATVFADAHSQDGEPWPAAPRGVLKAAMALYAARGWRPVVAPELEFYVAAMNGDPAAALSPATGVSGWAEAAAQPCGLEALGEFSPVIDTIYADARLAGLDLDVLSQESGTGQLEINFLHGDPVRLADQVGLFKRIVRRAAVTHGMHATFMAKPMADQPGSAMHLHISVVGADGANLFADDDGGNSVMFGRFIAGLQKYLPRVTPLFAPNVNSFRRMRPRQSQPVNVEWGRDNRSCGLRQPICDRHNRRIECRLPGADANPYLAITAALIAGYLGIEEALTPTPEVEGNAYARPRTLPRTFEEGFDRFAACGPVRALLGAPFVAAFTAVKQAELEAFQSVVTPWEREHLLLRV
jgi:glutamine synthetase